MADSSPHEASFIEMRQINKSFGAVHALEGADLELRRGEIHGLLGGNGAGKTTLMNVLYGLYRADSGDILKDGAPVEIRSPKDALDHGIGMVHQRFLQIETFTVVENVVLGETLEHHWRLDLGPERRRIEQLSSQFGLQADPKATVASLPMGVRQRVEILKALFRGVRLLILDEPTTNLTPQEVDSLFASLRTMVDQGMTVVFITHKLREVMAVCDRISVLRNGRCRMTVARHEAQEESLIHEMVGDELDVASSLVFADRAAPTPQAEKMDLPPALQVSDLNVVDKKEIPLVRDASFEVDQGEILGIAGVAGNGQKALVESLLNIRPRLRGQIKLSTADATGLDTRRLLEAGMAYIPEDRFRDGSLPTASVADNLILGAQRQPPYARRGLLNGEIVHQSALDLITEYSIRTQGPSEVAARLSGGNLQRMLIARAFARPVRVLIAHNPTGGLDIASVEFVYRQLLERCRQGMACLLVSDDLDELLLLSHRLAVIYRGALVGEVTRESYDKYEIGRMMSGASAGD